MSTPHDQQSLAVPDDEVAKLIIGTDLPKPTRDKLRAEGRWPKHFYIAGRAFVLRRDIAEFLETRKSAAADERAPLSERGRRAASIRWLRARERQAAEKNDA